MAWSSKSQIETSASVAGTEVFSDKVELNPGEMCAVQIKADFPGSPTDDLEVRLYGTLDASSETYDNQGTIATLLSNSDDPAYKTILISGYYAFRLGFIRSGSTDTITVDAWIRKDGVSL